MRSNLSIDHSQKEPPIQKKADQKSRRFYFFAFQYALLQSLENTSATDLWSKMLYSQGKYRDLKVD